MAETSLTPAQWAAVSEFVAKTARRQTAALLREETRLRLMMAARFRAKGAALAALAQAADGGFAASSDAASVTETRRS